MLPVSPATAVVARCRYVVTGRRWHTSTPGAPSTSRGIEQFTAAQQNLPARDPALPGSGAQQQVRRLYRSFLKEAEKKTNPADRERLRAYIRAQFRENASIPRTHFHRIEWLLHQAASQLDLLRQTDPDDGFHVFQ
eukprot:Sspe_Gene.118000::Locus_110451_Transcript_1_1_Confidence_1.000_Length_502::g.118000::m.118000/K18167/SDHAF1; succinate dehydrogenase assembly factor 1